MKRHLIIILLVIQFFGIHTIVGQQEAFNTNQLSDKIDTYLNNSVKNGYSVSVLVANKGEIVLSKGYGWADRKGKIPNTSSTVFNIGSITKQFTAAAILKLVEQEKLKTSDDLGTFFKEAPVDKKTITIHQLLTHTSGISPQTGGFRYHEASKEQFLNEFFNSKLQSKPGTKHLYANANYIVLSAIIEHVSGQDYTSFLQDNFWTPLKMDHTGYKSIAFDSKYLAHGYYFNYSDGIWNDWGTTQEHLPNTNNHWYSIGKGDIHSTVEDLYTWHLALTTGKVLNAKTLEMFETPYVSENEKSTSHYGYGWAIFKTKRNTKIVTHNGSNGIYFANFIRFVDDDVVAIVLSNTILNQDSENVAWYISKMVFDDDYTPRPVTKSIYELVYDFTKTHSVSDINELPNYIAANLGNKHKDKSVLNRVGYKLLAKEQTPAWGLALLKLNVELFYEDGNLWDSLGDAYFKYGENENAIKSFTKAMELKPENNCHWCENSQSKLKQLKEKVKQ